MKQLCSSWVVGLNSVPKWLDYIMDLGIHAAKHVDLSEASRFWPFSLCLSDVINLLLWNMQGPNKKNTLLTAPGSLLFGVAGVRLCEIV